MQVVCKENDQDTRFLDIDEVSNQIFGDLVSVEPSNNEKVKQAGRVKTRLLKIGDYLRNGCPDEQVSGQDLKCGAPEVARSGRRLYGWLVVDEGAGQGVTFPLADEVVSIGRAEDKGIRLDFGDTYISRTGHATLQYCASSKTVAIHDGEKVNPVRVNGVAVDGARALRHRDQIMVGRTTLRFVANA